MFSLPPPTLADYQALRSRPALVADSCISPKAQQLYAKTAAGVSVSSDSALFYKKYCSFDTTSFDKTFSTVSV